MRDTQETGLFVRRKVSTGNGRNATRPPQSGVKINSSFLLSVRLVMLHMESRYQPKFAKSHKAHLCEFGYILTTEGHYRPRSPRARYVHEQSNLSHETFLCALGVRIQYDSANVDLVFLSRCFN